MKRLWLVVALIALVVPAASQAKGGGEVKKPAKQHCKALRADIGEEAFRSTFAGKDGKRAMKRCVKAQRKLRKRARSACRAKGKRGHALKRCVAEQMGSESTASPESFKNAAVKCKAMQADDPEGFAEEFGDGSNAFGKCVSEIAHEESGDDDAEHEDDPVEDEPAEHEPADPDDL